MTTTINISLSKEIYQKAKKLVKEGKYHSISELVRAGLRRTFEDADKITENGFPGWFEDRVLEVDEKPIGKESVWETEEDIKRFFKKLRKKIEREKRVRNGKDHTDWSVQPITR